MSWAEAKARTVEQWQGIREALGKAHPTDLLTEINLICSLCYEAAAERDVDSTPGPDKCAYCIAYHQAGGCREVCGEISARIAERDWEAARQLADHFIETLEQLKLPTEETDLAASQS